MDPASDTTPETTNNRGVIANALKDKSKTPISPEQISEISAAILGGLHSKVEQLDRLHEKITRAASSWTPGEQVEVMHLGTESYFHLLDSYLSNFEEVDRADGAGLKVGRQHDEEDKLGDDSEVNLEVYANRLGYMHGLLQAGIMTGKVSKDIDKQLAAATDGYGSLFNKAIAQPASLKQATKDEGTPPTLSQFTSSTLDSLSHAHFIVNEYKEGIKAGRHDGGAPQVVPNIMPE